MRRQHSGLLQFDPERRTLAEDGINAGVTAHPLGSFLYDGEAQAAPWLRSVQTMERLEKAWQALSRYTRPMIFDHDADHVAMVLTMDMEKRRLADPSVF